MKEMVLLFSNSCHILPIKDDEDEKQMTENLTNILKGLTENKTCIVQFGSLRFIAHAMFGFYTRPVSTKPSYQEEMLDLIKKQMNEGEDWRSNED